MPSPSGVVTIAVDLDGTLVEDHVAPLRWRPKAKEFILGAAAAGVDLVLFSCRCAFAAGLNEAGPWDADEFWRAGVASTALEHSWMLYEEMRGFLTLEGVWGLMRPWTLPGKPLADYYIDDRAEVPDFYRLAGELGIHLAHAFPGGAGPVVLGGTPAPPTGAAVLAAAPGAGGAAAAPGAPAGVRLGS